MSTVQRQPAPHSTETVSRHSGFAASDNSAQFRAEKKFFEANELRAEHQRVMCSTARAMRKNQAIVTDANFDRQRPRNADWLLASRIRAFASYFLVIEAGLAHRALVARAIRVSKQAITKQLNYWSNRRDEKPAQTERIIELVRRDLGRL